MSALSAVLSAVRAAVVRLRHGRPDGNVILAFALCLGLVAAASGSAIDYGRAAMARTKLQAAVDGAVIAGAKDTSTAWSASATNALLVQYAPAEAGGIASDFAKATDGTVTGTASQSVPTAFMGLFQVASITISVSSRAKLVTTGSRVCVLLKSTAAQALTVNSGANVTAPNCEVHVASAASPAVIFNASTTLSTKRICIAGAAVIDNGGTHPNVVKSCTTVTDPFAGTLPAPPSTTCQYNGGNWNGGTASLTPGVYCGWYNFNGAPTVSFAPGVYVIKGGGMNVNGGTWTGSGVTFYFDDSSVIQFNSAVKATLKAPTTGTYAGILFYEKAGLGQSNFVFDDSLGHDLDGLMWLPSRNVTFNSGSQVAADKLTMVFNTLILNSMTWAIDLSTTKGMTTTGAVAGSGGSGGVHLLQ
ncbi:Tad domain-containing protein [Oharaeibacter diazotrophicus]|uniref:Putative Flp pilus-assembly TadE/G-like protein n=1 Tax=Oharaeibacter diazotrophicus TaxID=1920512 RepID=A0A4V3CVD5_9HYPH|nr:Tad domain-containing protein [Oharaeibacter diazotrophicus]TDP82018.1 putative Flp pilus-assembly TadE/G-like protein [Oharaeibacter diazotrophicus]BBE73650.1 hypothetical protein OHA_1_03264 [Pleomorphomonas sp. SM30]GLS75439.1 hypothetical protein GCM10007904_07740 [Oharaeibacter diazotrophicus]